MESEVVAESLTLAWGVEHVQIPLSCSERDWWGVFAADDRLIDSLG